MWRIPSTGAAYGPIIIRIESHETAGSGTTTGAGVPGVMVAFPNGTLAHFGQGSERVLMEVLTKSMGLVLRKH